MSQITITIPDAQVQRVKDALGDNPKEKIIFLIKNAVKAYESQKLVELAVTNMLNEIDVT